MFRSEIKARNFDPICTKCNLHFSRHPLPTDLVWLRNIIKGAGRGRLFKGCVGHFRPKDRAELVRRGMIAKPAPTFDPLCRVCDVPFSTHGSTACPGTGCYTTEDALELERRGMIPPWSKQGRARLRSTHRSGAVTVESRG